MASVQKAAPQSPPEPPERSAAPGRRWLLALLLGVCLLYGAGLGRIDLWAPDEPRYGAIAEELRSMRHGATGLVLLHLNDTPYTQKPPLFFWLAALAGAPEGRVDELAARLPSALAGLLAVALTAWVGRRLLRDPMAGLLAAGVLATSFRFAFSARRVQLDVLLTAFELIAIALFLSLELERGGVERARRHPGRIALLHGALGAAALVKGPVGWLPLLIFLAYLVWQRRARSLRALCPVWAWALSIGPLGLWIAAAIALAPPGFAAEAVGENVFGRFFAGTSHARPFYYYAYQLPLDFLPWSLVLPLALGLVWREARPARAESLREPVEPTPQRAASRFLLVWMAVPLAFFSLSAGKRGVYLLPIFPALALVVARAATARTSGPRIWRGAQGLRILAIVAAIELAVFVLALPAIDDQKSPRPIAEAAAARSRPDERIGVYGMSPLEGAIGYYGERPVASLRSQAELLAYLREDGRLVVLRARHLEAFGGALDLVELESFRSGRRRLVLAAPAGRSPHPELR